MEYIYILITCGVFMIFEWTTIVGLNNQHECNYGVSTLTNQLFRFVPKNNSVLHDVQLDLFDNSTNVCYLNVNNLRMTLLNMTAPDYTENSTVDIPLFYITVNCRSLQTIVFHSGFEFQVKLDVVIVFLHNCWYKASSIPHVTAAFTILSFSDTSGSLIREPIHNCTWADDLTMLSMTIISDTSPLNISYFLDCITILHKVESLLMVNFSGNKWTFSDYIPIFQEKFPNVLQVDLSYDDLTTPPKFPWIQQTAPTNITSAIFNLIILRLNLNFNNITCLNMFQFNSGIDLLFLKGNHLSNVSNYTFQLLDTLQELDLSHNNLISFPPGTFSNLVKLKKLTISHNQLSRLNNNTFQNLRSLQYLDLAYNQLSVLPKELLENSQELSEIYLAHNNLHIVPDELLKPPLRVLTINRNPLDVIPINIFYISTLEYVNLQFTGISQRHLHRLLQKLDTLSVPNSLNYDNPQHLRATIDMSHCQIQYIPINVRLSRSSGLALLKLLENFKLKLDFNPIDCECKMDDFLRVMKSLFAVPNFDSTSMVYIVEEWKCAVPQQFKGQPIWNVSPGDMYCPINTTDCPSVCSCYTRLYPESIIVDCSKTNITSLPDTLPPFTRELWFAESSLANITLRPYLENITRFNLAVNNITYIDPHVFQVMHRLAQILLHRNLLSHLPESIMLLNSSIITLSENPYICDCNMKWMKDWLINSESQIVDVYQVKCIRQGQGQQIILVPDEDFVCTVPFQLHPVKHIVLPAIVSVSGFLSVVTVMFIVYAYRQELKVVLFLYTGWHPFDKEQDVNEIWVDVTIVHAKADTDWVIENVVDVLELHNYRVVVSARDFLAGISYQENLRRFMKISSRLMICVSQTLANDSEWFDIAWDFSIHKIKRNKTNFVIVTNRDFPKQHLRDKDLKLYIRSSKYIDFRKMLFQAKLLYNMPRGHPRTNREDMISMNEEVVNVFHADFCCDRHAVQHKSAFLSYEDEDVGYVAQQLLPLLEDHGFKLYLPDRDFELGLPKADNISEAIENCGHTILVLSEYGVISEWNRFAFIQARDKSFSAACNHLIVILRGNVDTGKLTDDFRQYIKSVITLSTDDRWFHKKLYNALRINVGQMCTDVQNEENDPLLQ